MRKLWLIAAAVSVGLAACSGGSSDLLGDGSNAVDGDPISGPASGPAGPPPELAVPALSEDLPCGFLLGAADVGQTSLLMFTLNDTTSGSGPLPVRSAVADDVWTARFERGSDLLANWCDDVVEPGESTRQVTEEWPVVNGIIEVTRQPSGDGSCGVVEATLSGLVIERPDGERVGFGDMLLVNPSWGCVAG